MKVDRTIRVPTSAKGNYFTLHPHQTCGDPLWSSSRSSAMQSRRMVQNA